MTLYPEYPWLPWKFDTIPRRFWENSENRRNFFDWVKTQLSITDNTDWYNVRYYKLPQIKCFSNRLKPNKFLIWAEKHYLKCIMGHCPGRYNQFIMNIILTFGNFLKFPKVKN